MKLKTIALLSLLTLVAVCSVSYAQTYSVIHAFTGQADGADPEAGVTYRAGILYGTAAGGYGNGTVYEMTRNGNNWSTFPMTSFNNGGHYPRARVVFGPDGHPYGTTDGGGSHGYGLVFDLLPPLSICKAALCYWNDNSVYSFMGFMDGDYPGFGDLVWDQQGNIYGTTYSGGYNIDGGVYELQPSGHSWTKTAVYLFSGTDGSEPHHGVIFENNGNLVGTTLRGGPAQYSSSGTVFELTYVVGVGWKETVAYSFQNGSDGRFPWAGLISDSSGNLYGASSDGGAGGGGTVFELSPSGQTWTFKLLYSFSGPGNQCGPRGSLALDGAGNLYGTTYCDGANQFGSIFKLTNNGNGWTYSSLHDFTGGADGAAPWSNVTFDLDGNLYGTASQGGSFQGNCSFSGGCGVVWMIKP